MFLVGRVILISLSALLDLPQPSMEQFAEARLPVSRTGFLLRMGYQCCWFLLLVQMLLKGPSKLSIKVIIYLKMAVE